MAIWVGTCIGNQAKVKSVTGAVVVGRGRSGGDKGREVFFFFPGVYVCGL